MDPGNQKLSTADTVLLIMVMGGSVGGGASPEVHRHLHSFESIQLHVILTASGVQLSVVCGLQ